MTDTNFLIFIIINTFLNFLLVKAKLCKTFYQLFLQYYMDIHNHNLIHSLLLKIKQMMLLIPEAHSGCNANCIIKCS